MSWTTEMMPPAVAYQRHDMKYGVCGAPDTHWTRAMPPASSDHATEMLAIVSGVEIECEIFAIIRSRSRHPCDNILCKPQQTMRPAGKQAHMLASNDPWIFRQICYEVMVSTDQWCPDIIMLMEICGIDESMLEEEPDPEYLNEEELAPVPQAAEHVLDKINGDPLPRSVTLASNLRRILPPRAMTDATLLDNFTSIRNTLNNPLGLSATNIVAISSAPEEITNPVSNKCFRLFQYFLFDC